MTSPIDDVFRPGQSDFELGDAYEQRGFLGVHDLLRGRAEAKFTLYDEAHIRYTVAEMFGISPGDIVPYAVPPWGLVQLMLRLTVYACQGTHLVKDAVLQRVSKDLEGFAAEVRLVERDLPFTLVTFDEVPDTLAE